MDKRKDQQSLEERIIEQVRNRMLYVSYYFDGSGTASKLGIVFPPSPEDAETKDEGEFPLNNIRRELVRQAIRPVLAEYAANSNVDELNDIYELVEETLDTDPQFCPKTK